MAKKNTHAKSPRAQKTPSEPTNLPQADDAADTAAADVAPEPSTAEQLVLDFAREPDAHADLMDSHTPLPKGLQEVLERAAEAMSVLSQSIAAKEGGAEEKSADDDELADAMLVFVKKVFLAPGGDHYRVLGLERTATTEDVHRHYRWLRRLFWREETDPSGQSAVIRISEAYVALRDPQSRRLYSDRSSGRRNSVFISDSTPDRLPAIAQTPPARRSERRGRNGMLWGAILLVTAAGGLGYWLRQSEVTEEQVSEQPIAPAPESVAEAEDQGDLAPIELPTAPALEPVPVESEVNSAPDEDLLSRVDAFVSDKPDVAAQTEQVDLIPEQEPVAREPVEPPPVAASAPVQPTPEELRAKEIAALLKKGRVQFNDSLLTQPSGNNAYDTYQQVLALDPFNAEARQGLRDIADRYVGLTRYRLERERYAEALDMAEKGLAVVPDHDQLLVLQGLAEERLAAQQAPVVSPAVSAPVLTVPPDEGVQPEFSREPALVEADEQVAEEPPVEALAPQFDAAAVASEPAASAATGIAVIPVRPQVQEEPVSVTPEPPPSVVASIPPPAPAAAPQQTQRGLSDQVLTDLVQRFVNRYEAGDLTAFMELFAEDARTNNRVSKSGVRDDYAALFDSTESRLMRLRDVRWSRDKEMAIGEGDFSLNILKKGERRPRAFEGSLTFQVYLVDGEPKIRGLYHAQRKIAR